MTILDIPQEGEVNADRCGVKTLMTTKNNSGSVDVPTGQLLDGGDDGDGNGSSFQHVIGQDIGDGGSSKL